MKRIERLKTEILVAIEKQKAKIENATKAHEIMSAVDWLDQEMFDYSQKITRKLQKAIYLPTNKDFDEFYDKEES